ncbi:ParA family protein [Sulfuriflexus mobilis]|uniref:ParA family protein n=1 Tax=Sulfuriflexus mobilis TaxID=1811807 RepID=UPI000F835CA9|nr:ParA family protein [Sulfuriflexus mobilis]
MRMIAVMNQKGGVGKTTTTLNLAHALALAGKSVTVIDMDPQAHLTASFGAEMKMQSGIDEVLLGESDINDVRVKVRDKLQLIPAGTRLGELEQVATGGARRGWLLSDAVKGLPGQDFVLIDCPPSSGMLTMNAMLAAKEMLIPVAGDYLSLHGLSRLLNILKHIETRLKHATKKWMVVTRFHGRRKLANEVRGKLMDYFPGQVLATPIRETVALAESPSFGQTIFEYQKSSNGAKDYLELADDLLKGRTFIK